ncbi:MAG: serine hydrolase, partial [bacterium]|nr:serine hydrolase [bacterium]
SDLYTSHKMHFDKKGFLFVLEFALFCTLAIAVAYGATAYAASYVYPQEPPAELDRQIEEVRAERALPEPAPEIVVSEVRVPQVSAEAFLVADAGTGEVFLEQKADYVHPIASITKLLTALVVDETIPRGAVLTITEKDRENSAGTPGSLAAGDSFTVSDLFYALLMDSNNSVANAFARQGGTRTFVRLLNEKAWEIGMYGTHFEDPTGLSKYNRSTANDLLTLIGYLHQQRSDLLAITTIDSQKITAQNGRTYTLGNRNHFEKDEAFLGGKTGYTDEAKQTMVTLFDISIDGANVPLAIIVLGSNNRKADVSALRKWFEDAATVRMPFVQSAN